MKEQEKEQDKASIPEEKLDAESYYSQLFKPVPGKQEASVPAKVVLDGKRKENELQSALDSFCSHSLESGKEASVQEKYKSVDVSDNNEEKNKKQKRK